MAQLAIKGHPTRGKEVIEILEMLGGKNIYACNAVEETNFYFIVVGEIDYDEEIYITDKYTVFTLEEFLEKFPYKVGDKVQRKGATSCGSVYEIEQIKWEDNQVKYIICDLYWKNCKCTVMSKDLQPYKEETMEENIKEKCDLINFNSHHIFVFADKVELILKDDWEVKNEDGRTYVVRKQPQYPKTYEECCKILGYDDRDTYCIFHTGADERLFEELYRLKVCRDAYWKIAGEEMGLGKPWEFENPSKHYVFTIENFGGKIQKNAVTAMILNRILVFPTAEIRDEFFENFKELIEQCKELL